MANTALQVKIGSIVSGEDLSDHLGRVVVLEAGKWMKVDATADITANLVMFGVVEATPQAGADRAVSVVVEGIVKVDCATGGAALASGAAAGVTATGQLGAYAAATGATVYQNKIGYVIDAAKGSAAGEFASVYIRGL